MSLSLTFLTWVRGHDEIFTPSLPGRGSLRKHWCSDVGDDRDLLCCSGFISSDEQAGISMIFIGEALSQVVSSDFSAAMTG